MTARASPYGSHIHRLSRGILVMAINPKAALGAAAIAVLLWAGPGAAQDADFHTESPGQPSTGVKRSEDGLTFQTPGRPPVYAKPQSDGSYRIEHPGAPPTTMKPTSDGGYMIEHPGRPPTYIKPSR
jgi:hypothetical protein